MAKRLTKSRPSKSKPSKRRASATRSVPKSATAAGTMQLQQVISELIDADQRGDHDAREKAVSALEVIRKGKAAAPLRQAAAEARAVAGNPVPADAASMLRNIVARLQASM